ncbi:MAG: diacylglycerol kinase family lipid kinase [Myxococcaceae bacterium]|nr:diacylglycerol kinase family lipid kinase [Myxococcaceae bacterium]
MKRVRVIVNPGAGGGRAMQRLARSLVPQAGVELEWVQSRSAGHLAELMNVAQREALHAVGLAGGDGTVQHALAGLEPGLNRVPIGVLPVGSGNDFALGCGVPRGVAQAMEVLVNGVARRVDLGVSREGRRFCCVAGVGLDELALRIIYASWLPRSKVLNVLAALRALVVYRPRHVRIAWEGGTFEGEVMFAAVANTRSYGGGFRVAPAAEVDDGALDLCIVRRTSRLKLLVNFPRIMKGTHGELDEVLLVKSPWVHIEGDDALPVPLDGELNLVQTPLELRCGGAALNLMVPA